MNALESQALTIPTNLKRNQDEMTSQDDVIENLTAEMNLMKKQLVNHSDLFALKDAEISTLKQAILSLQNKERHQSELIADLTKQMSERKTSGPTLPQTQEPEWNQLKAKKAKKEAKKNILESTPVSTPQASAKKTAEPSTSPVNPSTPAPLPRSYASAVKKSIPSFIRDAATATPEAILQSLLKTPTSPEKTTEVASLVVKIPLRAQARANFTLAQKSCQLAFQAATGCSPLLISQYHPGTAEIFIPADQLNTVTQAIMALDTKGWSILPKSYVEKDITRRARAYLRSYFLPLRLAALRGFSVEEQMTILDKAQSALINLPPATKKLWATNISYDRERVKDQDQDGMSW